MTDPLMRSIGPAGTYPKGRSPLGIAALEDKIVQAAAVMILTPIYEGNDESVRE